MADTFTKLFSSITASSVWDEDSDTRVVWITMLAMADKDGYVGASIPGLAAMARVSKERVVAALEKFMSPDPYSRTKDNDGRRVAEADRGWQLLNHKAFRDKRDEEIRKAQNAAAAARLRARKASCPDNDNGMTEHDASSKSAQADTDTDTDTDSDQIQIQIKETKTPSLRSGETRKREVSRPIDFPDFGAEQVTQNWHGQVVNRFRSLHLGAFQIEPNMGGKQVHAFPGQLKGTAEARGVDPIKLLDDTFLLWSQRPRDQIARGSPYAAFCARFGELVGSTQLGGDSSASDRLLEAISKARREDRFADMDKLDAQWAKQFGGSK